METIINDEMSKLINNCVDLFEFMGLDKEKFCNPDFMFTPDYLKQLKKVMTKNSRKYHTDKHPHAKDDEKKELEKKFNLNQIIYYILATKEVYEQYLKVVFELQHTHFDLKNNYNKLTDEDIKAMIRESTGGKTYEELCKEKDRQHGIDRSLEGKMTEDEYNKKLQNMVNNRNNIYEEIKNNTKKMEFDKNEKFADLFNKKFDDQITRNVLTQEIQTFNDVNTLNTMFNYQSFDYGNMFDNGYSSINDSFSLLSTNIPSEFSDSRTLEERMQAYHNKTKEYKIITKGANANVNLPEQTHPVASNNYSNVNVDEFLNNEI